MPSGAVQAATDARRAEALGARLPPLLVAAERVAATVAQGVHGRRRVGQGDSFWQFRRFVPGDPIARIDWRQSAKSGRPVPDGWFIRETEWEAAQTVCLWRDASASMRWRSRGAPVEKRERAGLLLLALASLLLRGGERVAMIEPGARPISGRAGLDRLAEALAGVADDDAGLPPRVLLPRHARVVLFGDFLSPLTEIQAIDRQAGRDSGQRLPAAGARSGGSRPALHRAHPLPRPGARGDTLIPRVEGVRDEYAPSPEGAAGRLGCDLCGRRLRLRHPPHRPSARGRAAWPLSALTAR